MDGRERDCGRGSNQAAFKGKLYTFKSSHPIGLQLVGRAFDEASLFRVGDTFEQATSWHDTRPPAAPG